MPPMLSQHPQRLNEFMSVGEFYNQHRLYDITCQHLALVSYLISAARTSHIGPQYLNSTIRLQLLLWEHHATLWLLRFFLLKLIGQW